MEVLEEVVNSKVKSHAVLDRKACSKWKVYDDMIAVSYGLIN